MNKFMIMFALSRDLETNLCLDFHISMITAMP